jgi:hypothetical protein
MISIAEINILRKYEDRQLIDEKIVRQMTKLHSLWFKGLQYPEKALNSTSFLCAVWLLFDPAQPDSVIADLYFQKNVNVEESTLTFVFILLSFVLIFP